MTQPQKSSIPTLDYSFASFFQDLFYVLAQGCKACAAVSVVAGFLWFSVLNLTDRTAAGFTAAECLLAGLAGAAASLGLLGVLSWLSAVLHRWMPTDDGQA